MLIQEFIRAKRDGEVLDPSAIEAFVAGIVGGQVGSDQLGAFAMAVYLQGMDETECMALTRAMRDSGTVLDWSDADLPGPVLDKHSTGGVGDSVSLLLGPWVAACGGCVPMIAGSGLGHTGGTVDKLSSIPGYDLYPEPERFRRLVRENGVAIIGQTAQLAPADRRLYAVRDVTATVDSIPLIVASILSKKLAAGIDALVMDIKTGCGSVMGDQARARTLAQAIARVARGIGTPVKTMITDMNQALARNAGNALEVREVIAIARGDQDGGRLLELSRELSAAMLVAGRLAACREEAVGKLDQAMQSGQVAERLARMVRSLGGPADLLDRPDHHLPAAPVTLDVLADGAGFIQSIDLRSVGLAIVELGGGRRREGDRIDTAVGLENIAALGDSVEHLPLARIHARNRTQAEGAAEQIRKAFIIGNSPPDLPPLIYQ